jgi:hypothetical protein
VILYLYALADALAASDVSGLTGVLGEAVVLVDAGGMTVAGGWLAQAPDLTRDTLIAQDRLVRELHARAPALLPMRFGSTLAEEHMARDFVERRRIVLQEQLDLVRGREQMTLRVLGETRLPEAARAENAEQVDAGGVGRRYLARRAAERVPPLLRPLVDRLQPFQRAMRVESHQHPQLVATIYHLVDRGAADAYRRAIDDAKLPEGLRVRVSGPSPAYAFASAP